VLLHEVEVARGNGVRVEQGVGAVGGLGTARAADAAVDHQWATWMPWGPSSRAMLWASPRKANLPMANGADWA
jgi:hypothetical protein